MREILFKAKRKNWKEFSEEWWVEGNLFIHNDGKLVDISTGNEKYTSCTRVDPSTICQYTGLHDGTTWEQLSKMEQENFLSEWNEKENRKNQKEDWNGKKIWENDIVETVYDGKQNPNYVVVWDKDELDFKATNGKEHYKTNYEYLGCCDEIVVIGNIFDNPELLGGVLDGCD